MHDTALSIVQRFFDLYVKTAAPLIVEIGAMNVNGSPRDVSPVDAIYFGLDCAPGPGVDCVTAPNRPLPLRSDFADVVLSTSQMEHDPFFWTTFPELLRILKPGGLLYLNVPSNGCFHRYPKDYWRFYPDAGVALQNWGRAGRLRCDAAGRILRRRRMGDIWNDFVAVFKKQPFVGDEDLGHLAEHFPGANVRLGTEPDMVLQVNSETEDQLIIARLRADLAGLEQKTAQLTAEIEALRAKSKPKPKSKPSRPRPKSR